jgi:hypothetical protein
MKNKIPPQLPRKMNSAKVKLKTTYLLTPISLFCILLLHAIAFSPQLKAQHTISSAGGELIGTAGSVSFTAGQVFFHNYTGENGSVSEGIQQPFEIFVVTQIDEIPQIDLEAVAFPNPVSGKLNLKVEIQPSENLFYQLYYINVGMLATERITSDNTVIDMEGRFRGFIF